MPYAVIVKTLEEEHSIVTGIPYDDYNRAEEFAEIVHDTLDAVIPEPRRRTMEVFVVEYKFSGELSRTAI